MGFDARFSAGLIGWLAATLLALAALVAAFLTGDLMAARLLAGIVLVAVIAGLQRHVTRTNRTVASFLEALRHGEFAARFDKRGGAGFERLGAAMDEALLDLQRKRAEGERELRFLEAMVDDAPVAMLTVEEARGVRLASKAARRMFGVHDGTRPDDFRIYGATFAGRLADPRDGVRELLILNLGGGLQRALVRTARMERLGMPVHIVSVEPVQGTLDSVEMAAQTDLVRVLTHEIMNSLTPVTSLSRTVDALLREDAPDLEAARTGMATLARRAEGLRNFIESYRTIARAPQPRVRRFEAAPFIREMARLFAAEWPDCRLSVEVPAALSLEADPDLLAQLLINLMRNAAQAAASRPDPHVRLAVLDEGEGVSLEVEDNGPGIPPDRRAEVFLPFYTTRAGGSGVGLNLVRQIVVASGWSIDIRDGALGGALFRIST